MDFDKKEVGGKSNWKEYLALALMWYVPVGILFPFLHKDPEISTLGWFGIYLASPVIVLAGFMAILAAVLAVCIPAIWIWRKFSLSLHWSRYEAVLGEIETRSKNAKRDGQRWKAWAWMAVWFVLAIPLIVLAMLLSGGER